MAWIRNSVHPPSVAIRRFVKRTVTPRTNLGPTCVGKRGLLAGYPRNEYRDIPGSRRVSKSC